MRLREIARSAAEPARYAGKEKQRVAQLEFTSRRRWSGTAANRERAPNSMLSVDKSSLGWLIQWIGLTAIKFIRTTSRMQPRGKPASDGAANRPAIPRFCDAAGFRELRGMRFAIA